MDRAGTLPRGTATAFFSIFLCGVCSTFATDAKLKPPGDTERGQYYGFKRTEVVKLEERSSNLLTGDFNDDGLTDLLVFDNGHARLDLLLQQKNRSAKLAESGPVGVNDVKGDEQFKHKRISLDKQLASMAVGDFNGDHRTDIACFGIPDRLVVWYQPKSGEWKERASIRIPDVNPAQWNMAAGDLNNDGKDDLVILGKHQTYLLLQRSEGKLAPPTQLMNTSEKLSMAQVGDFDGDGRNDLCYVAGDGHDKTLCARLQDSAGRIGPELQFEVDRPRSVSYAEIDGLPGREILTIDAQTGRLRILQLKHASAAEADRSARLMQWGFGSDESGSGGRDSSLGDIDGDGLTDLVVTDPNQAAVIVFRQHKGEGLDPGQSFPSLSGVSQIRIANFDSPGTPDVIVLSTKEKTIGISRFQGGRLPFPEPLPIPDDEPVLLEVADVNGDKRSDIVFVSRVRQSRSTQYVLHALEHTGGKWRPIAFGSKEQTQVPLEITGTPTHLMRFDTNHDGLADFLLFQGSDTPPMVLASKPDHRIAAVPGNEGLRLGSVGAGSVFLTNDPVPTILGAQENFARKLQRGSDETWRVVEQYNASEPSARIVGAALLDLDGKPDREVVLVDTGVRKLRILRREGDVCRPWREIELGSFPFEATRVADLNGDGREDLLLMGRGRFAVLYAGKAVPTMNELGVFGTKLKKAFFADVVAGDLNGDGQTDLALIDTQSHYVEILYLDAAHQPHHAFHFKVFEEKSFNEGQEGGTEPRESAIADVTGDGRPDLILLTHDRILVYPQDDGK
jgi:hypothetical protein